MTSFDIELALVKLDPVEFHEVKNHLPSGYLVEDKVDLEWGFVIRNVDNTSGTNNLNESVVTFLEGILPIEQWIIHSSSILRVAVYSDKVTCAIRLRCFDLLNRYGIELDLPVYPL